MRALVLFLLVTISLKVQSQDNLPDPQPYFSALIVKDLNASLEWYSTTFGFKVIHEMGSSEDGYEIMLLKRGNILLEVMELKKAVAPEERIPNYNDQMYLQGIFKVGFQLEDFDKWVEHLKAANVALRVDVFKDVNLGKRMLIVKDPDGNYIQLFEK